MRLAAVVQRPDPIRGLLPQTVIQVLFQGFALLLPIILLPFITRHVPPAGYGQYALYMTIGGFIFTVLSCGYDQLLHNMYWRRTPAEKAGMTVSYLAILGGGFVVLSALMVVGQVKLGDLLGWPTALVIGLALWPVLVALAAVGQAVTVVEQAAWWQGVFIAGRVAIAYAVAMLLLSTSEAGWLALVLGQGVALLVMALVALGMMHRYGLLQARPEWPVARGVVREGWPLMLFALIFAGHALLERLLIARLLDDAALGVYAVLMTLMMAFFLAFSAVGRVTGPYILRQRSLATAVADAAVVRVCLLVWLAMVSVFTVVALVAPVVVGWLLNAAYLDGYPGLVSFMALSALGFTLCAHVGSLLGYEQRAGASAMTAAAGSVLTLLLGGVLMPLIGLYGMALAGCIGFSTAAVGGFMLLRRYGRMPWRAGLADVAGILRHAPQEAYRVWAARGP